MKTGLIALALLCFGTAAADKLSEPTAKALQRAQTGADSYSAYRLFYSSFRLNKNADYATAPQFGGPTYAAMVKAGFDPNTLGNGSQNAVYVAFYNSVQTILNGPNRFAVLKACTIP